jgi:peptidoglycan/LPS O-acetylase OafA/YrhL
VSESVAAAEITPKPDKRVQGIDVLRGLCIIAVVLHHINLRIHFNQSAFGVMIGPAANRVLFWSGYYGVRAFFVISGFLITSWSLQRWGSLKNISLRQFYTMRFARIVPCLLGLLALLVILDRAGVPRFVVNTQHTSLWRALLAALTFHVNWLEARTGYLPAAWDVLWSLSVEEVFYVFFPLLCKWIRKEFLLIALLGVFVILGPFARTVLTHNDLWQDYGYLACMDGIAIGCLAAIVAGKISAGKVIASKISAGEFSPSNHTRLTLNSLKVAGTVLCLLIVVFRGIAARIGFYKVGLDVTVLELGASLLVIAYGLEQQLGTNVVQGRLAKAGLIFTAPLRWFGRNSYEVYLTHMLVVWPMVWAFFHFQQSLNAAPVWFLATAALTGVFGYLFARLYSEPLNRMLRTKMLPATTR